MTDAATSSSDAAAQSRSIRSRAASAAVWTVIGQGLSQGLRLLGNVVLSRLLAPEAFGLMAIVRTIMSGLEMISDVGIRANIVHHKRGEDRAYLNTAWTLQAVRGAVLWMIGVALAVPAARFYGKSELAGLIAGTTATALLAGLTSTKGAVQNRKLNLGRVVAIDITSQVLALIAMIVYASFSASAWALAWGGIVAGISQLVLSHVALPGARDRFQWDHAAFAEISSFGKWVFISTLITFAAQRLDVMVLGKLLPLAMLGVYSMGQLVARVPEQVSTQLIGSVLYPMFSAAYRVGPEELRTTFTRVRRVVMPAGMFIVVGAALAAPPFFEIFFDDRYVDAGWITQLSLLRIWFTFTMSSAGYTLMAMGNSGAIAGLNAVRLLGTTVGAFIGYWLGGLPGFILGLALGSASGYVTVSRLLAKHGLASFLTDMRFTVIGIAVTCLGAYMPRAQPAALQYGPWTALAVAILLLVPLAVWVVPPLLRMRRSAGR